MTDLDFLELGKNIREQREKVGIKQCELANVLDITPQHISHIESGSSRPSLELLVDIANILKTDGNILLGKALKHTHKQTVLARLSAGLDGVPEALLEHCLTLCEKEVAFYKKVDGGRR